MIDDGADSHVALPFSRILVFFRVQICYKGTRNMKEKYFLKNVYILIHTLPAGRKRKSTSTNCQSHLLLHVPPVWMSAQHEKYVQHVNTRPWRECLSGSIDVCQAHHRPERIEKINIHVHHVHFYTPQTAALL